MPVDEEGNRADIVMDPNSRVNRMNIGGLTEQYINAASRDVGKRIRKLLGIDQGDHHAKTKVEEIFYQNPALFLQAWEYLIGYYKIIAPKQYLWCTDGSMDDEEKIEHIANLCFDHIYVYIPPEDSPEYMEAIKKIERSYRPVYGPVEYIGYSGNKVKTKTNVRIGSMYIMLLEKTGDDWSSVASGKTQHFGVIAKLTKEDKSNEPIRAQPIKGVGETEGRIFASYTGARATAELMDRNNNPSTHAEIVKQILIADKPTGIKELIDRTKFPFGNTKPLQILNHIALCAGWKFEYEQKQTPAPYKPYPAVNYRIQNKK